MARGRSRSARGRHSAVARNARASRSYRRKTTTNRKKANPVRRKGATSARGVAPKGITGTSRYRNQVIRDLNRRNK